MFRIQNQIARVALVDFHDRFHRSHLGFLLFLLTGLLLFQLTLFLSSARVEIEATGRRLFVQLVLFHHLLPPIEIAVRGDGKEHVRTVDGQRVMR